MWLTLTARLIFRGWFFNLDLIFLHHDRCLTLWHKTATAATVSKL